MLSELLDLGFILSIDKVRHLIAWLGLVAAHRYPAGKRASFILPNRLNRQFTPEKLNRYWPGDITYIRTGQGWLYLAVSLDLCSRRVFSWTFSDKPNSELTTRVLRLAVQKRQIKSNVIFHSDLDCQYTSDSFQESLKKGIEGSMSRAENCLDNTVTEQFFRSLKSGRVSYRRYDTRH